MKEFAVDGIIYAFNRITKETEEIPSLKAWVKVRESDGNIEDYVKRKVSYFLS